MIACLDALAVARAALYLGTHTWRMKGRSPVYFCVDCGKTSKAEPSRSGGGEPPVPPGGHPGPV
jgi:hypothetical protein